MLNYVMRKILLNVFLIFIITQPVVSQVNNGWQWANPYPNGMTLNDPNFFDVNTGYCIALNKLLKTTDGGLNWVNVSSGYSNIYTYHFINENTGWIIEDGSSLYKTTNSGANWNLISGNFINNCSEIVFLNENLGIAIGNEVYPPMYGTKGEILSTTNGGINWNLFSDTTLIDLRSIEYLNPNLAIVLSRTATYPFDTTVFIVSTNQGQSWNKEYFNEEMPIDLHLLDDSTYFFLSFYNALKTTDAGANWQYMTLFHRYPQYYNIGFWNMNTGIVTSENNKIELTTNSGMDWTFNLFFATIPPCYQLSLLEDGRAVMTGKYGTVIKTTDYGTNWETDTYTASWNRLTTVRKIDENKILSVGVDGTILLSTNKGANWVNRNWNPSSDLHAIEFINSSTGFTGGQNGLILKTTNSGNNWYSLNSGTSNLLYDIEFINSNTGYTAGQYGNLYKTTNGGNNWILDHNFGISSLFEINFINESTGFLGTWGRTIYRTTNGGSNWTTHQYTGPTSDVRKIHFFDSMNGIAMTFHGQILRTTNSGENWIYETTLISPFFFDMKFVNQNTGYILAGKYTDNENPYYFKTTDGGINWDTNFIGLESNLLLNGVEFLNDSIGVIVGAEGTIFRTTTGGETINIQAITSEIPSEFTLYQNYPNPFNPITKIKFAIPKVSNVKISIYDILGRKVTSLINQKLQSGTYETQWNAGGFASGVYFYSLEAEGYKETRKMLLVK